MLRYVSHPEVIQDPAVAVPNWSLSEHGRQRTEALLGQAWIDDVGRVISSAETKALQTAASIGQHLGVDVEVRPLTGEIDRSSTGYVSTERHDDLSQRLFSQPAISADGWETAVGAQQRVVGALSDVLSFGDVVVVGHGGVGTLLMCHLANLEIDQAHDQPGQGHFWTYDPAARRVIHQWWPIDDLGPAASQG